MLRYQRIMLLEARAMSPTFNFNTAMLFWLVVGLPPLITSFVYFQASSATESITQRIGVSLHGATLSIIFIGAVLVGMLGTPDPAFGKTFCFLLLVPIVLIIYSFWGFQGNKVVHFLQVYNLFWLFFTFFFGGMMVTGQWL